MLLILPTSDTIFINIQWTHKEKYYFLESSQVLRKKDQQQVHKTEGISVLYFLLLFVPVWKTQKADMNFSMYCPRMWFSDFSCRFSTLTKSTLTERASTVYGNSNTWLVSHVFRAGPVPLEGQHQLHPGQHSPSWLTNFWTLDTKSLMNGLLFEESRAGASGETTQALTLGPTRNKNFDWLTPIVPTYGTAFELVKINTFPYFLF